MINNLINNNIKQKEPTLIILLKFLFRLYAIPLYLDIISIFTLLLCNWHMLLNCEILLPSIILYFSISTSTMTLPMSYSMKGVIF